MRGHLTEENVLRAQEANIAKALIDELIVGDNVQMGPNAYISWSKVLDQPDISGLALKAWEDSDYATHIDANGVYSGSFNGGMFNVNPTGSETLPSGITIGGYYESLWHGQALQIKYEPYANGFPGTVFSSDGGVDIFFDTSVNFRSYARFLDNVDFTGSTVIGLPTSIYKFG
jgi:hypothetical protein